jgi:hypothetical protein
MQNLPYAFPGDDAFEMCPKPIYAALVAFANWPVPLELKIAMIPKLP